MGFTNHINFLTIETYISSEFKNKSGFYISLFWSSAGFGAILGSLIIAFNGVNYLSYVIAILLIVFQFLPVFVSKSSILLTKVEKVEFSLSYNVINNIKFIFVKWHIKYITMDYFNIVIMKISVFKKSLGGYI